MKWIQDSPGKYKLVEDDDERPEVKLKKRSGVPTVKFTPSWKKHEAEMNSPLIGDKEQMKATDKFMAEREKELKNNPKAKRWEESRKKTWARNKPVWRKQIMRRGDI